MLDYLRVLAICSVRRNWCSGPLYDTADADLTWDLTIPNSRVGKSILWALRPREAALDRMRWFEPPTELMLSPTAGFQHLLVFALGSTGGP